MDMRAAYNLTLLAKNKQGYQNLCKLSSIGYLEGFYYYPRIDDELLAIHREGLICLDGSLGTRLAHEILHGNAESVQSHACNGIRSSLEMIIISICSAILMSPGRYPEPMGFIRNLGSFSNTKIICKRQQKVNETLIALSRQHAIPLVATNDIHYIRSGRLACP